MADMLKFRKGLFKNLPEVSANTVGTIYVTTDEQAMYVDVAADKRIRISDFIRVSSVKDITPPYSTSSLYYVEADNALLKYVETTVDGTTTGTWKQVNGTDDLRTSLTAVTNRVSSTESKITALETAVGKAAEGENAATGLHANIKALETAVGTAKTENDAATGLHADIEALKAAVGMNEEGEVEGLAGSVADIRKDLTTAQGDIDSLEGTVAGHTTKISALETASAKHALKTDLDAYAKSADVYTKTQVYTKDEVDAAIDADVLVETNRAKAAELALENAAKAAQQTANAAVTKESFAEFQESNTEAIAAAAESATTAANGYTDGKITAEVTRADGAYAPKSLVQTVNGHASKIDILNGSGDGSVAQAKARADEAYALADAAVTTSELSDAIANFATKTEVANAKTAVLGEANYGGTVKGAYEAAAAAKKAADDANELASEKTTAAEVKTQIEAYGYATVTKATELATAAKNEAINDAKKYALQTSLDATNGIVGGHTTKLDTLTGSGAGSVAEAKKAGDDAAAALTEYKNAHKDDYTNAQIDTAVADAKKAGTDAQTTANTANNQANANKAAIEKLNGSATTEGSVAKAIADAEGRLDTKITNKINAANAMDYKGGVASEDALFQKTSVKVGDTYVATKDFTFTDGRAVYPGDLLIASGDEVNGVIAVPTWEIVHTGYDATLEQKIKTIEGKVVLLSAVGANNGEIAFVADENSAAKVTVANDTVTIGMEWDNF